MQAFTEEFGPIIGRSDMAVTDIGQSGERQDGLPWQLPGILREIELEAGSTLVRELISVFEADACERIQLALRAADRDDRPSLRHHCYRLSASSRQLGVTGLAEMFERIERDSDAVPVSELKAILKGASDEFVQVCRRMKSYSGLDQVRAFRRGLELPMVFENRSRSVHKRMM